MGWEWLEWIFFFSPFLFLSWINPFVGGKKPGNIGIFHSQLSFPLPRGSFGNSSRAFSPLFLGKFGKQDLAGKGRKGKAANKGKKGIFPWWRMEDFSCKMELKSRWIGKLPWDKIWKFGMCFIPLPFLSRSPLDLFPSIFKSPCIIQMPLPWISSFQGLFLPQDSLEILPGFAPSSTFPLRVQG